MMSNAEGVSSVDGWFDNSVRDVRLALRQDRLARQVEVALEGCADLQWSWRSVVTIDRSGVVKVVLWDQSRDSSAGDDLVYVLLTVSAGGRFQGSTFTVDAGAGSVAHDHSRTTVLRVVRETPQPPRVQSLLTDDDGVLGRAGVDGLPPAVIERICSAMLGGAEGW